MLGTLIATAGGDLPAGTYTLTLEAQTVKASIAAPPGGWITFVLGLLQSILGAVGVTLPASTSQKK